LWAISGIGASPSGLQFLLRNSQLAANWLEYAASSNAELRSGCLAGIAQIFASRYFTHPTLSFSTANGEFRRRERKDLDIADKSQLNALYNRIFESNQRPTAEALYRYLNEKVVELRFATLQLLLSVVAFDFVRVSISRP